MKTRVIYLLFAAICATAITFAAKSADIFRIETVARADSREAVPGTNAPNSCKLAGMENSHCEKVVFVSPRADHTFDIASMNSDGSAFTRLLSSGMNGNAPLVSPNGTKVLFHQQTEVFGRGSLYIMNLDGSGLIQLTNNNSESPGRYCFSPDGTKILFTRNPAGVYIDLFTINIDGTGLTRLTDDDGQADRYASYSPDGSKIIFVREDQVAGTSFSDTLYLMNSDGTGRVRITTGHEDSYDPHFTPDGTQVVFETISRDNDHWKVEVVNLNGLGRTVLFESTDILSGSQITPNGSGVLFFKVASSFTDIYSVAIDGSNLTNLTNQSGRAYQPKISRDGSSVYFAEAPNGTDVWDNRIYRMDIDGGNRVMLTTSVDGSFLPSLAYYDPDGDGVTEPCDNCPSTANTAQTDTDNDGFGDACDPDDDNDGIADASDNCPIHNNPDQLDTDNDGQGNACDADDDNDGINDGPDNCPLTANQYRVAFSSSRAGGNPEIYTMNADGSDVVRLTNNTFTDQHPRFSPDGRRIIFSSNRNNSRYEIYVMDADGSNVVRLTNIAGDNLQPSYSADGTRITFVSKRISARENIFIMNADGSNQVQLTNVFPRQAFNPSFDPTGTRILFDKSYTVSGITYRDIFTMDTTGNNVEQLTQEVIGSNREPSYSRDGSKISFTSSRNGGIPHVYTMNANGSNQSRLTTLADQESSPSFSPDGARVIFWNITGGKLSIVNTDGTGLAQIPGTVATDTYPSFATQADTDGDGIGDSCDSSFDRSTPTGSNVAVQGPLTSAVTFAGVTQPGTTSFTNITLSEGDMPTGFQLCEQCAAFDITTTAVYTPPVTVCLNVPPVIPNWLFVSLRLMHGEGGVFVDRTTNRTDDGQGHRSVCGTVDSLSPFALASLNPTAAHVSVAGRVTSASGYGIRNAKIVLTGPDGVTKLAVTSSFGYYRFDDIAAGENYVIRVASKRYVFANATRVIAVNDDLTEVDFVAEKPLE